jgi:hypothetical protein
MKLLFDYDVQKSKKYNLVYKYNYVIINHWEIVNVSIFEVETQSKMVNVLKGVLIEW